MKKLSVNRHALMGTTKHEKTLSETRTDMIDSYFLRLTINGSRSTFFHVNGYWSSVKTKTTGPVIARFIPSGTKGTG